MRASRADARISIQRATIQLHTFQDALRTVVCSSLLLCFSLLLSTLFTARFFNEPHIAIKLRFVVLDHRHSSHVHLRFIHADSWRKAMPARTEFGSGGSSERGMR